MSGPEPGLGLPYGPGFLFVDRVMFHAADGRIVTEKEFRATDPILRAHFDGGPPVVPGVILVEMASQSALLWALRHGRLAPGARLLLGSIKATFLHQAVADCEVTARVTVESPAGGFAFKGELWSDDHNLARVHGLGMAVPTGEPG